jgi:hypothetical protein
VAHDETQREEAAEHPVRGRRRGAEIQERGERRAGEEQPERDVRIPDRVQRVAGVAAQALDVDDRPLGLAGFHRSLLDFAVQSHRIANHFAMQSQAG